MSLSTRIKHILTLPESTRFQQDDPTTRRTARTLHTILLVTVIGIASSLIVQWIYAPPANKTFNLITNGLELLVALGMLIWLRRGGLRPVSLILVAFAFIATTYPNIAYADIRVGPAVFAYLVVMALATLLLGPFEIAATAALSAVALFLVQQGVARGLFTPQLSMPDPYSAWYSYLTILILSGSALAAAAYNLRLSITQERRQAQALAERNQDLRILNETLQDQVQARTAELQSQNEVLRQEQEHMRYRGRQMDLIARINDIISQPVETLALLTQIADSIHEGLGFYHIGIFLLDEQKRYAVLQAVNRRSEGGQRMLARRHQLAVGQVGIVGTVAATGLPRIALDTGADRVYFNNPDLPDTRSEMALPMLVGQQVIGVLDIQSRETNAFTEEDVQTFSTLARQIAYALDVRQQLAQAQEIAREAALIYQENMRREWRRMAHRRKITGLTQRGGQRKILEKPQTYPPEITRHLMQGKPYIESHGAQHRIVQPIILREQTMGSLDVSSSAPLEEMLALLDAISRRLALALENARLVDAAQERARHERQISAISAQLSASVSVDNILRTAAEELGELIPGAEVLIQFTSNDDEAAHE